MPELPEVETIRRELATRVVGRTVVAGWGHPSDRFAPAHLAAGHTIVDVRRRGKYLLVALIATTQAGPGRTAAAKPAAGRAPDRELVIHLGMTGSLSVERAPTDDPYVRARWLLDDGSALQLRDVRRFGRVAVVAVGDYSRLATLGALGPDPLDGELDAESLYRALARSRRRVKTQLLSQRPVAGVGNIYADEALWRAGIHPGARRVSRQRAARLAEALVEVIAAAVEAGGTTLRDYRTVAGEKGRYAQRLDCYGRAGLPCRRCGATLRREVLDGRGTTWCPACQRR